jgi:hypothetical protein
MSSHLRSHHLPINRKGCSLSSWILKVWCISLCITSLSLLFGASVSTSIARNTDPHFSHYQEISSQAERYVEELKLIEAIRLYEDLIDSYGTFGKVHFRLGQLYLKRVTVDASPEFVAQMKAFAGFHFLNCTKDPKVSAIIKTQVCEKGLKPLLSPLHLRGEVKSAQVLSPRPFQGRFISGDLLPNGPISIEVVTLESATPQLFNLQLPSQVPLNVSSERFIPARPQLKGDGLLRGSPPLDQATTPPRAPLFVTEKVKPKEEYTPSLIPGWVLVGVGAALVTTGVTLYLDRVSSPERTFEFDKLYPADLPAYIWAPGAVLSMAGTGWLVWAW